MSKIINVKITGDKSMIRTVRNVDKAVNDTARSEPEKMCQKLQRSLIIESPFYTGLLKSSWRRMRSSKNRWRVQSTEFRSAKRRSYAIWPQIGTKTTRQSSRGYVDRAIERVDPGRMYFAFEPIKRVT